MRHTQILKNKFSKVIRKSLKTAEYPINFSYNVSVQMLRKLETKHLHKPGECEITIIMILSFLTSLDSSKPMQKRISVNHGGLSTPITT